MTAAVLLSGCAVTSETPNALIPKGPAAEEIAGLWWVMLGVGTIVYLVVLGLLFLAIWRGRRDPTGPENWWGRNSRAFILSAGVIFPVIILFGVYIITLGVLRSVSQSGDSQRNVIEVIGHQWWWEVNYPEQDFRTANELHIPVGEKVQVRLRSADVIHSFWVPQLSGKLDLIPGRTNTLWVEADSPGEYWGLCAEFCGTQHAKMLFVVVAQPRQSYERWLTEQQEAAREPTAEAARLGRDLFMEGECADCHTIRGTEAAGDLGPDLTHFARRLTLGAGAAPNNRGHLAGWIADPHGLKPGNFMPATKLTGEELNTLVAYLETLE